MKAAFFADIHGNLPALDAAMAASRECHMIPGRIEARRHWQLGGRLLHYPPQR
jgi:hypothetical protein